MDYVIETSHLRKVYQLYASPWQRLKALLTGRGQVREFVALDDVTIRVAKGSALGVLGANGAGKSTLLRILAGVAEPTEGDVTIRGRVGAILELGAGFHPEFTGRENVLMNASLLGFPPERTQELLRRVEESCELGPYFDLPVKTYSSGMFVRLAFSAAIAVNPDILLVDEALAVGDAVFAHRSLARVRELREQGCTIVFVTHDTATLTQICDRAILLSKGRIVADGLPRDVVDYYLVQVAEQLAARGNGISSAIHTLGARELTSSAEKRFGSFEVEIVEHALESVDGKSLDRVVTSTPVRFRFLAKFHRRVENPVFGIMIKNRYGVEVFGTNTHLQGLTTGVFEAGEMACVYVDTPLYLGAGSYAASFAVHTADGHFFDYRVDTLLFEVIGDSTTIGIVNLPAIVSVTKEDASGKAPLSDLAAQLFSDAPPVLDMTETCRRFLAGHWHTIEQDQEGSYRWLGREGLAFIARGSGTNLELDVQTFAPDVSENPIVVRVLVNGYEIGTLELNSQERHKAIMAVPHDFLRKVNTVTLSASRVWSPAQFTPGSTDSRELSILVRRIALP